MGSVGALIDNMYKPATNTMTIKRATQYLLLLSCTLLGACNKAPNGIARQPQPDGPTDANEQLALAMVLYEGSDNVPQDHKRAFYWFQKAAKAGNAAAQFALSQCYSLGHGIQKDAREAQRWLQRARAQGYNPDPRSSLGSFVWRLGRRASSSLGYASGSLRRAGGYASGSLRSLHRSLADFFGPPDNPDDNAPPS